MQAQISYAPVVIFRQIAVTFVLALWLAASQHCGLEAIGLIPHEVPHATASHCCDASGDPCTHDGCNVVEGAMVKPAPTSLKAPSVNLVACAYIICLQLVTPDVSAQPTLAVSEIDHAQNWVPIWQFVRRAAPLSRAPSLLG